MVRSGMAYHYKQYSNCPNRELIIDAEKFAQDKKIGVWSGNHVKPWDYRHAKK
jgi:endonuclease YncB( thermonuclease family)